MNGISLKQLIKRPLLNLYWGLQGLTVSNPRYPTAPRSFLFICKGNICRSVFAERLAVAMTSVNNVGNFVFSSAGLEVTAQLPPPPEALAAATRFSVHHGDHRSKQLTVEMMEQFDVVFAVEIPHLNRLRKLYPQFRDKIFLLPLFEGKPLRNVGSYYYYNIEDPYGKELEDFMFCFNRIQVCLKNLFA